MASEKRTNLASTKILNKSLIGDAEQLDSPNRFIVPREESNSKKFPSTASSNVIAGSSRVEELYTDDFSEFASFERPQSNVGHNERRVSTTATSIEDNTSAQRNESTRRWQVLLSSGQLPQGDSAEANNTVDSRAVSISSSDRAISSQLVSSIISSNKLPDKDAYLERFLSQIYDRSSQLRGFDSDTFTEASFSESFLSFVHCRPSPSASVSPVHSDRPTFAQSLSGAQLASDCDPESADVLSGAFFFKRNEAQLKAASLRELTNLHRDLQAYAQHVSSQLVRQVRRRDHALQRRTRYCDVITAIVQAASAHRRVDRNLKFSIEPQYAAQGENAFIQWKETMKAVVRLPCGLPSDFRRRMWLALADSHVCSIKVDWERTKRFAFNERQNPDDCALGLQIVKDLHRTGYSNFNGQDNEEDRAVLKRVLLGYARWNKHVGYCQGFNVIAALILDVVSRQEDEALKVFIYLIDHVLPESFFTNNLTALAVEMAVFRDLLKIYVPELSRHLETLQQLARDSNSGNNYEPPLTNVFTMQWFLTLFATCLPHDTVLRLWDVIMLEGCETLLRAALAVWYKLRSHLRTVHTADEFYCLMGTLSQRLLENQIITADELIRVMFNILPTPIPNIAELREKYQYNITPFAPAAAQQGRAKTKSTGLRRVADSDGAIGCFAAMFADTDASSDRRRPFAQNDISRVGPGAFADDDEDRERALAAAAYPGHFAERMSTDVAALRKQYERLTHRHRQANVIISSAHRRYRDSVTSGTNGPGLANAGVVPNVMPAAPTSNVINHLLIGSASAPGSALRQLNVNNAGPAVSQPGGTNSKFVGVSPAVVHSAATAAVEQRAANRPSMPFDWQYRNALKWASANAESSNATSSDSFALSRRVGSLESLSIQIDAGSPQSANSQKAPTRVGGMVDGRASRGPLLSLRDLAKRRSSLTDETPHGPIDDTAFRSMLAQTLQQQRESVGRSPSDGGTEASADRDRDRGSSKDVESSQALPVSPPPQQQKEARRNAPDFATMETSVQQQPNANNEVYERVRGTDPRAERRPFSMHQPNPSSLQRIRKMNINACLQRGYMADMHNVKQAQRRKLHS